MRSRRVTWSGRLARRIPWWAWLGLTALLVAASRVWFVEVAGSLLALLVLLVGRWLYRRRRSPKIRDWQDAEWAAAVWLRRNGGRRVQLTSAGADGGVDVITRDLAVQVKHSTKRVGRPTIQQTVGAALTLDRAAAVFSTSGFSAPAVAYADENGVAIFELFRNGQAEPINQAARRLGRRF